MDWKIEVVPIPVADIDRAKAFYAETLGFVVDLDERFTEEYRIVQLTPPGSACSIMLGGELETAPGSIQGLQMVVQDIHAARAELDGRGLDVGDVQVFERGSLTPVPFQDSPPAGRDPRFDYGGFLFFKDPDGNGWTVQQMPPEGTG